MTITVKSYKDYDRKTVKIGDRIASVDVLTGTHIRDLGVVVKIEKDGYIVTPHTDKNEIKLGRYTRKI